MDAREEVADELAGRVVVAAAGSKAALSQWRWKSMPASGWPG